MSANCVRLRHHLQENIQLHYDLTSLERGGVKIYFISLGLPRFPNPILQLEQDNVRVLRPRCGNLTPQQHLQIQQLCHERQPPPPLPE